MSVNKLLIIRIMAEFSFENSSMLVVNNNTLMLVVVNMIFSQIPETYQVCDVFFLGTFTPSQCEKCFMYCSVLLSIEQSVAHMYSIL